MEVDHPFKLSMDQDCNVSDKFYRVHWVGIHKLNDAELVNICLN